MRGILGGSVVGQTVAIDGKTICSTDKLTPDGSVLHLASAIVSQYGLVIGTKECGTKTGEITAFRELVARLDVRSNCCGGCAALQRQAGGSRGGSGRRLFVFG